MAHKKISLEERLRRHATAREVGGLVGKGIDLLPVNELTRTMLKYKSNEVAVTVAETGAALVAAARDGVDGFQRARAEEAAREGVQDDAPPGAGARGAGPAGPSDADVSLHLERLASLHAAGRIDDREYLAAKAKVLGLD